jgi:uncharacterized membrane protein YcaP (DUF421 family)
MFLGIEPCKINKAKLSLQILLLKLRGDNNFALKNVQSKIFETLSI